MKYDKPLIAALTGALSTISGEIFTQVFIFIGIGKHSIYQLTSLFITLNRPTEIIGLVMEFALGGFVGISFYYALNKIGRDYMVVKSLFVSILFFFVAEITFTMFIEGRFIDIRPINDYYIHFGGAFVFGITQGLLFNRYLFNDVIHENK